MLRWHKKQVRINFWHGSVILIIILALSLRITLIALDWPSTNSDEATMGLMALHIAYHGELPIFFYGQNYMGALEAYLAAGLFHIFGPSLFSLRLGLELLFAAFLFVMYQLASLLYTRSLALVSTLLLCFGSAEMLTRQTKAVGGAVDTMLFGALVLWLAAYLALSLRADAGGEERQRRCWLYLLLGGCMGLGFWSHLLVMPFVLMALLLLLLFCRRELFSRRMLLALGLGTVVGALPVLIFNVQYPLQNSIVTFIQLRNVGGIATGSAPLAPFTWWDAVLGTVLLSLPMATGAAPVCVPSATPGLWREHISSCMFFQGAWGLAFLLLFAVSISLSLKDVLACYRSFQSSPTTDGRLALVRNTARLLLAGSAGLTLFSYLLSPAPAVVPITSARYLIGLLIATPALLWPLWSYQRGTPRWLPTRVSMILGRGLLAFIFMVLLCATYITWLDIPNAQKANLEQAGLIQKLKSLGATHVYSDYWTCNRLTFLSDEQIICSVVDEKLEPGQNRYPLYRPVVESDPHSFYLFTASAAQNAFFTSMVGVTYQRFTFDDYAIYRPEA